MNWTLTPAQQATRHFLDTPTSAVPGEDPAPRSRKPHYTDVELLTFVAEKYREFQRPPKPDELNPHRNTLTTRFKNINRALRLAAMQFLTTKEREAYVWRCQFCGRTAFKSSRGLAGHEKFCKAKEEKADQITFTPKPNQDT